MVRKNVLLRFALTFSLLLSFCAVGFGGSKAKAETRPAVNTVRYIRDSVNGSTANKYCHWAELEAYSGGKNVALHKVVACSAPATDSTYNNWQLATDGKYGSNDYYVEGGVGPAFIQVDLGQQYVLDYIRVRHYYVDNRTYHNVKTQVSSDGINWTTVFDSDVSGEYQESSAGHTIHLNISVTHPSSIAFNIDPNHSVPFMDAEIPLRNDSDVPVKVFVQEISRGSGGSLTLNNVISSKYPDWSKLTTAQTKSDIAFGIRVKEKASASGTWQSINQSGTVYTADMGKTLMGTLKAMGTGTLVLTANCGLAWDKQYTISNILSFLFDS